MLGQVLETILAHLSQLNFGYIIKEPIPTTEPEYARVVTVGVLRWKRCPRCRKLLSTDPSHLEFLTANRLAHSEIYRSVCQEGHRVFVSIFPMGFPDMFTQSQDEATDYLPKMCGPNRPLKTRTIEPLIAERGGNELVFKRTCGIAEHDHDEHLRYYEKPGWNVRPAIF